MGLRERERERGGESERQRRGGTMRRTLAWTTSVTPVATNVAFREPLKHTRYTPSACRGVSGFGFRVSGFGFRVSGFGFRVSGCGLRASDVGFRWGL